MTKDILGGQFRARTLPLRPGPDGDAVATLVHLPAKENTRGAVLFVHGYTDYFFQVHLAEHFADRGYDFYAVDLRGYGRSLLEHQTPNYVADLPVYFEDLDAAAAAIRADGHSSTVLLGHSTGGLIAPLWADSRRARNLVDALVLNSPWLDLAEPWHNRTIGTAVVKVVGRVTPNLVVRRDNATTYAQSLRSDQHGEWDYRLDWKPLQLFPVRAGWLRAIRRGHARLHRGLDVRVPVLVLHSDKSLLHTKQWSEAAMRADTVLDVKQIAHWAPKIGRQVTVVPIQDGLHDLFLSPQPARQRAFAAVDSWLDRVLPAQPRR